MTPLLVSSQLPNSYITLSENTSRIFRPVGVLPVFSCFVPSISTRLPVWPLLLFRFVSFHFQFVFRLRTFALSSTLSSLFFPEDVRRWHQLETPSNIGDNAIKPSRHASPAVRFARLLDFFRLKRWKDSRESSLFLLWTPRDKTTFWIFHRTFEDGCRYFFYSLYQKVHF